MGMRLPGRAVTICAVAGVLLAGLAAAGCARRPAGSQQAAVDSCVRFSISALEHRVTVTALPPACKGLTRARLTSAAGAAVAAVAGTMRGKRLMRARLRELSPLLPHLSPSVVAQHGVTLPAPAAGPAGGPPAGLAALVAWLVTVGLGFSMMAGWVTSGGLRRALAGRGRSRMGMNLAHLGLAVAGLVAWVIFLVTGWAGVAWIACALLLPVAGLGMSLLVVRLPGGSLAATAAQPVPAGVGAASAAGPPAAVARAPAAASAGPPPARHPPALVVAAHVAFAMATILYALLATIGSG